VTSRSHREVRWLHRAPTYIQHIHGKLHPVFADGFLASLIPPGLPRREDPLKATAEIVLDGRDGAVIQVGVVARSGSDAFDAGVLESIQRASAFGASTPGITSADGRVYIRWRFFRDEFYACTTYSVQAYLLVSSPEQADSEPTSNASQRR
jgi:hypothetical protein